VLVTVSALVGAWAAASNSEASRRPACTIEGTNGDEELIGTSGPDVICAFGGDDEVHGRGGDDVVYGGRGNDSVEAEGGDDRVLGGAGRDNLGGGRGTDRLLGQVGPDQLWDIWGVGLLFAGRGRDALWAQDLEGGDRLSGGTERDAYCADPGDVLRSVERIDCGV
jgi:Ca2+-binding RTX toxin-like protein